MDHWDRAAARLHGVTPKMLSDLGADPAVAADRMSAALAACDVYSDAPDWDGFWLMRLFEAAGRRCDIRILDFRNAVPAMTEAEKNVLLARADAAAPRRHRAGEDALHLQTIWRLAHTA